MEVLISSDVHSSSCCDANHAIVFKSVIFVRTILVANNIQLLRKDSSPMFTGQDVSKIRKFSRQRNVVSSGCRLFLLCLRSSFSAVSCHTVVDLLAHHFL